VLVQIAQLVLLVAILFLEVLLVKVAVVEACTTVALALVLYPALVALAAVQGKIIGLLGKVFLVKAMLEAYN
jgi:hypothetical protein